MAEGKGGEGRGAEEDCGECGGVGWARGSNEASRADNRNDGERQKNRTENSSTTGQPSKRTSEQDGVDRSWSMQERLEGF